MKDYRQPLRRVGWALIAVGTLDIGYMIYCIANQQSYSSSFNIFALIAGVFLVRGHLGAARLVTWFSAFMFTAFVLGSLLVFPWMQPLDYSLLTFRANPVGVLLSLVFLAFALGLLFWVYAQLRSPEVVEARAAAGHEIGPPKSAFIAGAMLAAGLGVMLPLMMKGDDAQEAIRRATVQYGADHKYFVSRINWSNSRVHAWLTAYNEHETKVVQVEWDK